MTITREIPEPRGLIVNCILCFLLITLFLMLVGIFVVVLRKNGRTFVINLVTI